MRRCFPFFAFALTACGVFGSSDSDSPADPPATDDAGTTSAPDVSGDGANSIFVSSSQGRSAAEGADGTLTHPFKTLADAFGAAKTQKKRVLACGETYEEAVVLADGVTAFGNYDCSVLPWVTSARHAMIKSPTSPAVTAENITQPTRLDGFDITSPDFDTQPAGDVASTSTALVIRSSASVTIANALIHAGKGGVGANGAEGTANVESGKVAGDAIPQGQGCPSFAFTCNQTTQKSGATGGKSTCAVGNPGGAGGNGGPGWWLVGANPNAQPDNHGLPLSTTTETKAGGAEGADGLAGAAGADGADGANGVYVMASTGFVPGDGAGGRNGSSGQGGGGGGGRKGWINDQMLYYSPNPPPDYSWGTAGAGGGAGGCGGVPGTAGKGGGASVAALVVASDVTFDHVRLESSAGGQGGQGTLGTDGLKGGNGGAPYNNGGNILTYKSYGSGGGAGGHGGSSGLSGHGATGPSIALAFAGQEPKLVESNLQPGPAGAGHDALTKKTSAATKTLAATTGDSIAKLEVH